MDKDPLSLLAGDSSSSDSECDDDPLKGKKSLRDESYYTPRETVSYKDCIIIIINNYYYYIINSGWQ